MLAHGKKIVIKSWEHHDCTGFAAVSLKEFSKTSVVCPMESIDRKLDHGKKQWIAQCKETSTLKHMVVCMPLENANEHKGSSPTNVPVIDKDPCRVSCYLHYI